MDCKPQHNSVVDACLHHALRRPDSVAYTFLVDGEDQECTLTCGEFDREARKIAAHLQQLGAEGERALLLFEPGLDFAAAFFGCLYAGVLPVPAYPPDPMRLERCLPRLRAIVDDAKASLVLGTALSLRWSDLLLNGLPSVQHVVDTTQLPDNGSVWRRRHYDLDDLAFLQYTSGSTGAPKGVMITHGAILYQVTQMMRWDVVDAVGVHWLPTYHDLGLVAGVLLPMYGNVPTISMSPYSFVQRPLRWLRAMSRYGGTTTGGPNFAYDLCVRKIKDEECEGLDLSRWTHALNGAEPVRPETLRAFVDKFSKFGLRPDVFRPSYGMAEATLGISGSNALRLPTVQDYQTQGLQSRRAVPAVPGSADRRTLVGCGPPLPDTEVAIVDPQSLRRCEDQQIGEIWVRSPSIAVGYWNRPEESKRSFEAHILREPRGGGVSSFPDEPLVDEPLVGEPLVGEPLVGEPLVGEPLVGEPLVGEPFSDEEPLSGPYLRTGDLGFLRDGELFITGRLKDLIIVAGRNHYPQDIERTVGKCHPDLKVDAGAAFSVDVDGQEELVIVQEISRPKKHCLETLMERISTAVVDEHEIAPHAIVLLKAGTIPKTTSGKLQRRGCRAAYLEGRLQVVASWSCNRRSACPERERVAPRTEIERQVAEIWGEVLGLDEVGVTDNFFEVGGQSLSATQLASRIRAQFGVEIPLGRVFADPTVAHLARIIEELSAGAEANVAPIAVVSRDGLLRPSPAQERLWLLDQLMMGQSHNIHASLRLSGSLDVAALTSALRAIVRRHESLRMTFDGAGGRPQMKLHEVACDAPVLAIEDLRSESCEGRESRLAEAGEQESRRRFDLARGPLYSFRLLRESDTESVFMLTLHHIVADGWSIAVLASEVAALYEAARQPSAEPLAALEELPVNYADYAQWQRAEVESPTVQRQLAYWEERLRDAPRQLELPTDRPRCGDVMPESERLEFRLDAALSREVDTLARRAGVTPFMALLAAYQTLLARHSGLDDICVGVPVAGRSRRELEPLIGLFVNTVVLRSDLSNDPSFSGLLGQVRSATLEALANQEAPWDRVVERIAPARVSGQNPLFQAMFALQNLPCQSVELPDLDVAPLQIASQGSGLDVTFELRGTEDGYHGCCEFNSRLFDRRTIERLVSHYQRLLRAATQDPDQRLSVISLLSQDERQGLLAGKCDEPDWVHPAAPCVPQMIEAVAWQRPDSPALRWRGETWSYRQLNARANQLARLLRRDGARRGELIGVCLDRSPELIVSLLAILKLRASYVPVDPGYPAARQRLLLQDSGVTRMITRRARGNDDCDASQESLFAATREAAEGNAAANRAPRTIDLDEQAGLIGEFSDEDLNEASRPGDIAYVVYTSGSTGRPKGVLIEHRGWRNTALVLGQQLQVDADSVVIQSSSPSFDGALAEIAMTLCHGALLTLPDRDGDLERHLREERVGVCFLPPAAWAVLSPERLPDLHTAISVGDVCPPELARKWGSERRFFNGYGPTEITVCATLHRCRGDERRPPIGAPIANTRAYVLDKHRRLAPVGAAGELYLSGAGVARGYHNRSALTEQRFLANPFADAVGDGDPDVSRLHARMYKTGDLVRWRDDGGLEFLGRVDQQVKLRGFRIELGEVESSLASHPRVELAAAALQSVGGGESSPKQLVAYVTVASAPASESGVDAATEGVSEEGLEAELLGFLRRRLPPHCVPTAVAILDQMPLDPNGKVDHRSLPPLNRVGGASLAPPRNALERQLTRIWSELLHVEEIGIHDNFFDLGGDSLTAIQLASQAAAAGIAMSPLQLFRCQTISELARACRDAASSPEIGGAAPHIGGLGQVLAPIQPEGDLPPLFLAHPAGGNAFPYLKLAQHLGSNQPVFGFQSRGLADELAPHQTVEAMAQDYVAILLQAQPAGPYRLGGWSLGGLVAYHMAALLIEQGREVESVVLLDISAEAADESDDQGFVELQDLLPAGVAMTLAEFEALDSDEQLDFFRRRIESVGLIDGAAASEMGRRMLTVLKANAAAGRQYRPPAADVRVDLIQAAETPRALDSSWRRVARRGVELHRTPGNHLSMMNDPHIVPLAHCLQQILVPASVIS